MQGDDPREVLTRPAPPPDRTIRYGDHPDQLIDLRLPAVGQPPRPLVAVIHGGFWRAAYDRTHTGPLAADLAARGYPVAQLEYRRTGQPGGGWPGTFDDIAAAMSMLSDGDWQAPGGDSALPPVVLGHSAGGHLALWWAGQPGARVRAVVALAPVVDLAAAHRLNLGDGAVAALLGGPPQAWPQRYEAAEPAPPPPGTAVTVVHGDQDQQVPVAFSRRWVAAARARGHSVNLVDLPGVEHFGLIDPRSEAWLSVTKAIAETG